MTLKEALDANRGIGPGFHMMRHVLSFLILAHHLRVMVIGDDANNSYVKGSLVGDLTTMQFIVELIRPGLYALVGMFFALSGFLVLGSALRNPSVRVFFANRALRIIPALSVEVTLSAIVLGPLVTTMPLSTYFTDFDFFRYFGNIFGFVHLTLPGVFINNPWPDIVNGNLWTLPPEFWCYAVMLAILTLGVITHHIKLSIATGVLLVTALILCAVFPDTYSVKADTTHFTVWYIVMMLFFRRRRLPECPIYRSSLGALRRVRCWLLHCSADKYPRALERSLSHVLYGLHWNDAVREV